MIRGAIPADASRLAEIYIFAKRTAYRSIFQNDQVSFNEMQVLPLALDFLHNSELLKDLYVLDDGIVRGLMRWNRGEEGQGLWELKELYVDPFFQHGGYGRKLMEDFLEHACARSMRFAVLWVLEKNTNARSFYERFGFSPDGARKLQPGTDQFLLRYRKTLP